MFTVMVPSAVTKLLWWVADYLYAARWQAASIFGRARLADYASGDRSPVLVIPGIWETWSFMRPVMDAVHDAGHPVYAVASLRSNKAPLAASGAAVGEFLVVKNLRNVLIVAHSKGGLIGKYAMALADDERRILGMIAVSAPFSGSRYARFLLLPSLRALAPADPTIVRLTGLSEVNERIISVYPVFDPHIPGGSELPGARNIVLPTGGHFRVLGLPETIEIVRDRLGPKNG